MNQLQYYGLDWLAMALSVIAVYLIGNKNKLGFISFLMANVIWIVVGLVMLNSYGIAVGNIVFFILNTRGFFSWRGNQT